MFSSPTPAPGARTIAASALRGAGLTADRDTTMRDVERPTGRKAASKHRSHRVRVYDLNGTGSSSRMVIDLSSLSLDYLKPTAYEPHDVARSSLPGSQTVQHPTSFPYVELQGYRFPALVETPPASSRILAGKSTRTLEHWTEFVKKRYDPQTKCLNLDSIQDDEIIRKHGLQTPGKAGGTAREAGVIFKLASKLKPPVCLISLHVSFDPTIVFYKVETVSLANNGLIGQHLTYLDKYLPRIVNLSLQNNNLRGWKDLEFISGRRGKLLKLRELVLMGNPVRENEYQTGNGDRFKREALRRFLTLELLDQEPVTKIAFDVAQVDPTAPTAVAVPAPSATTFPFKMGPSFIDGVDPAVVSNFLSRFLPMFDTQRPQLADAYTPASTFSFSANTTIPSRARIEGLHHHPQLPNQPKLSWKPWIDGGSRNLQRLSNDKIASALHVGGPDIIQAFVNLPVTKHDLLGAPENFSVDAFLTGPGLLVIVHGQFIEAPSQGIRSFDRTFILAPAPEDSRARANGWDVVILSDQWTIRGFSKPDAWKTGPLLVQATIDTNPPVNPRHLPADQMALLNTVPEAQRPAVLELCGRSRLNVKYALDCLNGNAWDIERALANFNEVKATLPPDAFLRPMAS
ncbi:hypothetical protein MIND_00219200 [Mycena indigotica]|uniref:NTF2-like protein n=1 Tax=Mycena indigotica TaxID=2126181 RepID=A0A8H6T9Z7_9AGAR|nr:uncharacterized protein MIND_00219200 [Mycena indigotica]KAF7312070.1 hypothetical protein MIND_00219200 [Mycena indigotica]